MRRCRSRTRRPSSHDVLGDRANPVTLSLLGFVIDAGRAREIPKIVEELARMASAERRARARRGPVRGGADAPNSAIAWREALSHARPAARST